MAKKKIRSVYRILTRDNLGCWYCIAYAVSILDVVAFYVRRRRELNDFKVLRYKVYNLVANPLAYEDLTDVVRETGSKIVVNHE